MRQVDIDAAQGFAKKRPPESPEWDAEYDAWTDEAWASAEASTDSFEFMRIARGEEDGPTSRAI